jgi:hypothetical protein
MSTRLTSFRSFSQGTYGRTYNSCSVGNGSHQGGGSSSRIANYNKRYAMVGATTNTCTLNNTNYPNYLTNGIIFNKENYNGPSGYTLTQSVTLGNCIYNVQQDYYLLIPQGIQLTINNGSTITTSSGQGYFSNVGTINGSNTLTITIIQLYNAGNTNVSLQYVNSIPIYTLALNNYINSLSNPATNTNYAYITIVINANTVLSASDSTIPANVTLQLNSGNGSELGISNNITNNGSIQIGDGPYQGDNYSGTLVLYNITITTNPVPTYTITNNNLIYTFPNGQIIDPGSGSITNSGIFVG